MIDPKFYNINISYQPLVDMNLGVTGSVKYGGYWQGSMLEVGIVATGSTPVACLNNLLYGTYSAQYNGTQPATFKRYW